MASVSRRPGRRRCCLRRNAGLTPEGCTREPAHADEYGGFTGAGISLERTAGLAQSCNRNRRQGQKPVAPGSNHRFDLPRPSRRAADNQDDHGFIVAVDHAHDRRDLRKELPPKWYQA